MAATATTTRGLAEEVLPDAMAKHRLAHLRSGTRPN